MLSCCLRMGSVMFMIEVLSMMRNCVRVRMLRVS